MPAFLPHDAVTVCAECARAFRVALVPIPWSEVERAFVREPATLADFEWLRARVLPSRRRTVDALERSSVAPGRKVAAALSGVVVVLLALVLGKAVFQ